MKQFFKYSRTRLLFVLVGLLMVAVAGTAVSSRSTRAESSGGEPYGFIDQERGTYLMAYLDPNQDGFGKFVFAVPQVGLFLADAPAQVEIKSATSVLIRYNGAGVLDRKAKLDPVYTVWTQPSGETEPVSFRLEAQVNPQRQTASAQLWYDSQMYKLNSKAPTAKADQTVAAIISATQRQDWAGLYRLADRELQGSMTEAEFVAWVRDGLAPLGTVTSVRLVQAPVYTSPKVGYHLAEAQVEVVLSKNGAPTTLREQVMLLYDGADWKFTSIDQME